MERRWAFGLGQKLSDNPRDTRLTTVWKWWDVSPRGRAYRLEKLGVSIRPLPYDELSREEKDIVYHYFSTGEIKPKGGSMNEAVIESVAAKAAVSAATLVGTKMAEQLAKKQEEEALHQSPISPHCERVLETPPLCWDFRGIRSYVLCKAWDIMEKEKRIRLPVAEAWREARAVCRMD